jgi:hypothetical protein
VYGIFQGQRALQKSYYGKQNPGNNQHPVVMARKASIRFFALIFLQEAFVWLFGAV